MSSSTDVNNGARVTLVRKAGEQHNVLRVEGGTGDYCKKPCNRCPWRKDSVGVFPPEAFRISAHTAYDMAKEGFGCHSRGRKLPATCAGFLLKGAAHNLQIRLRLLRGVIQDDVKDGGHELFDNYTAMAIANGVAADDPILQPCRSNNR